MQNEEIVNLDGIRKALKDNRAATLTMGICEIVAHEESRHATMIVLASLCGALMKKGETEIVEKLTDFIGTI